MHKIYRSSLNREREHRQTSTKTSAQSLPQKQTGIRHNKSPDALPTRASRKGLEPGVGFLQDLMTRCRGGAIKVGPASNFGGKFDGVEIELVSLAGECKEATLWFGELAGEAPFRATSLPTGETIAGHPLDCSVPITRLGRLLFDPDPAVVRSGLVDLVADRHGLNRLDGAFADGIIRSSAANR